MTESLDDTRGRIAYDGTRTPLKTMLFLVLCFTWLLPGLVGHDPWKGDEATVFGAVVEMLRSGDWLAFRIAGEPYYGDAPLYLWTAATCAKLFGGMLALHDAARLASGVFVAATLGFVSLACRELMGKRAPRVGVMLLIGCVGLLLRAHEMITALAGLLGIAMGLYGLALVARRPAAGGAMAGAGIGVAFLGGGFLPVGMLAMLMGLLPLVSPFWRTRGYAVGAGVAVLCAVPIAAIWPLALAHHSPAAFHAWIAQAGAAHWSDPLSSEDGLDIIYFARILPWYAWPAWPLAAWSLWRSRRTLAARRDLLLPLTAFAAFFIMASVFGQAREVNALALLLPLAILGVAELDSLPRGAASALDWFGMTTFFLFGAMLWVGWFAATSGKPAFAREIIAREVPGFRYHFDFVAVALAALLTLIWLAVVARSLRSTRRALVNWTSGIAMVWMLAMMLGLPLVDQAKSYRAVASRVVENLPNGFRCVARDNVGDAQRALLDYFVNLDTVPMGTPAAARCRALLVQASPLHVLAPLPGWTEAWRGSRPGDRNELFLLYQRD